MLEVTKRSLGSLMERHWLCDLGSAAFFQVKNRGTGSIILTLNTGHPVYDSLIEVLEPTRRA